MLLEKKIISMNKILITGATGFIGSHLVELCVERGFDVVAFDRYNTNNHWGWLEEYEYKTDIEVILGDIRDYDSVYKSIFFCSSKKLGTKSFSDFKLTIILSPIFTDLFSFNLE